MAETMEPRYVPPPLDDPHDPNRQPTVVTDGSVRPISQYQDFGRNPEPGKLLTGFQPVSSLLPTPLQTAPGQKIVVAAIGSSRRQIILEDE